MALGSRGTLPASTAGALTRACSLGCLLEQSYTPLSGVVVSHGGDTCSVTSDKTLHFSVSDFLLESVTQIVRNKSSQDFSPYALMHHSSRNK